MSEADILATTYDDTVTAYRAMKEVLESGESVFKNKTEGLTVCRDTPCALSSHSGGKLSQSPSTASADTDYCLFTRPETDIQANDWLVISHLGKTIEAVAGRADRLASHNNIPIKLQPEVV